MNTNHELIPASTAAALEPEVWAEYLAKLTDAERELAAKARLQEMTAAAHGILARLYIGMLANSLMGRPKYRKRLINELAELLCLSTSAVYQAARTVRRLPDAIKCLEHANGVIPNRITFNHLVALTGVTGVPDDQEEKRKWFEDSFERINTENIPANNTRAVFERGGASRPAEAESAAAVADSQNDNEPKSAESAEFQKIIASLRERTDDGRRFTNTLTAQMTESAKRCTPQDAADAHAELETACKDHVAMHEERLKNIRKSMCALKNAIATQKES